MPRLPTAPLISQPTNGTGGNATNPMEPPKPVHMNKEDEAKKGKPYSLHCVVAPDSGNPFIEWSAEKNKIDLGKVIRYNLNYEED